MSPLVFVCKTTLYQYDSKASPFWVGTVGARVVVNKMRLVYFFLQPEGQDTNGTDRLTEYFHELFFSIYGADEKQFVSFRERQVGIRAD